MHEIQEVFTPATDKILSFRGWTNLYKNMGKIYYQDPDQFTKYV